ncbi:MAG: hypothetical protein U0414_21425 [Polyangiaceae bacterium]
MVRRAWLTLVAAFMACGPPRSTPRPAPTPSASAPASSAAVEAACPPIDLAALEPAMRPDETRRFTLGDVFPRDQARAPGATPMTIHLGKLTYASARPGRAPSEWVPPAGMEFSRGVLPSGVRPSLEPLFETWIAAFETLFARGHAARLLKSRRRVLELEPLPGAESPELKCVVAATDAATRDRDAASDAERLARIALKDALASAADASADERYLYGFLLYRTRGEDGTSEDVVRSRLRKAMDSVALDEGAPRSLRHLAERALGRGVCDDEDSVRAAHLTRAAALADDPREELVDLRGAASLAPPGPARTKALEALLPRFIASTGDSARDDRAELQSEIARALVADGDLEGALPLFAACLESARLTVEEPTDPYGCVTRLAAALETLGGVSGASAKIEVPVTYAGALGFAVMSNATTALDRDTARRAGAFVMATEPTATDAVHVLFGLADLTADPSARAGYDARRTRDFGRESAWFIEQRRRIVSFGWPPDDIETLLTRSGGRCPDEPTDEDGWRVELTTLRAPKIRDDCVGALIEDHAPRVAIHIDTTGPYPTSQIEASASAPAASSCVARAITVGFRSVPPARITLVLDR